MDHDQVSVVGDVGVSVDIIGFAMRRPSGVAHARSRGQGLRADIVFEFGYLALLLKDLHMVIEQGNTGTVIASVFQLLQALYQDRIRRTGTDISDYSTHKIIELEDLKY